MYGTRIRTYVRVLKRMYTGRSIERETNAKVCSIQGDINSLKSLMALLAGLPLILLNSLSSPVALLACLPLIMLNSLSILVALLACLPLILLYSPISMMAMCREMSQCT
jgi:hypothetical protein